MTTPDRRSNLGRLPSSSGLRASLLLLTVTLPFGCSDGADTDPVGTGPVGTDPGGLTFTFTPETPAFDGIWMEQELRVTVREGTSIVADPQVVWTSDAPGVVQVEDGATPDRARLLSVGVGSARITAAVGNASGSVTVPVAAVPPPNLFADGIEAGIHHTCAIRTGQPLLCWGINVQSQLGDDTAIDRLTPSIAGGGLVATAVAAARSHTCALDADGAAFCWGANVLSQLGDGSDEPSATPVQVAGGIAFTELHSSDHFNANVTCGFDAARELHCWGNLQGPGSLLQGPLPVAGGLTFTHLSMYAWVCGLVAAGDAYCWDNARRMRIDPPVLVGGGHTFTSVAAGVRHACALTEDGSAYCWGRGAEGQLGDSARVTRPEPVPVAGGLAFRSLHLGNERSCGLTIEGEAYCWGRIFPSPAVGDVKLVPTRVPGGVLFAELAVGTEHTCGRTEAGGVYCWGINNFGQLGRGDRTATVGEMASFVPVPVSAAP